MGRMAAMEHNRKKRPLLLLSGLLCDETIWAEIAGHLADAADMRIVSFPGFSSIGMMAEHALANAPARFALAGHSMGGRVALEVLRRAPHRVLGIALLNTGVHARREFEDESRGRLVRLAYARGMAALAEEWLPPMLAAGSDRTALLLPRLKQMIARSTPDDYAAQIEALLNRPDARPILATIKVPTLLLSGTADIWSPISQHERMGRAIPHAMLAEIEGAGHMAPVERPDAVAHALRGWLETIPAAR